MKIAAGALVLFSLGSVASAQTASLFNGGFEVLCQFNCGCSGPFAEGWHSPGCDDIARRRFVGDGLLPALSPVGTPGALTPRTGDALLALGTRGTGGFEGTHTDTLNFCYCDQTCQTACPAPFPFFDPYWDYNGGDIVVQGWYMIPASDPIVGDAAGMKVQVRVLNQPVATIETLSITGHTNGEWQQFTQVFTRDEVQAHYECNTGARPDCGCGCVPTSPLPNRVNISLQRFVGDGTPTSGTIYWDDITYQQLPPAPPCGTADFDGDGDTGTDADIEAFFACLAGNCCATCFPGGADFNGDGDTGTDADIESFFRVLAGGPC
jgi:hypothetical protein